MHPTSEKQAMKTTEYLAETAGSKKTYRRWKDPKTAIAEQENE
jgi:hypothetical protein